MIFSSLISNRKSQYNAIIAQFFLYYKKTFLWTNIAYLEVFVLPEFWPIMNPIIKM